jgi:hypothetical protein
MHRYISPWFSARVTMKTFLCCPLKTINIQENQPCYVTDQSDFRSLIYGLPQTSVDL